MMTSTLLYKSFSQCRWPAICIVLCCLLPGCSYGQFYPGEPDMRNVVRETQARQIIALVHAKQQDPLAEYELLEIVERFKKAGSRNYQTTYTALSEYSYYVGDQIRSLYYSLEADLGTRIVFENHGGTRVSLVLKYEPNEKEKMRSSLFN